MGAEAGSREINSVARTRRYNRKREKQILARNLHANLTLLQRTYNFPVIEGPFEIICRCEGGGGGHLGWFLI